MTDLAVLDNPMWSALTTAQGAMARVNGVARRFEREVSPLVGLREYTREAFGDLSGLVEVGDKLAIFTTEPVEIPAPWQVMRTLWLDQMVCAKRPAVAEGDVMKLTERDVPEMLALTAATEPGPFVARTIKFGGYFGIKTKEGRLASMAGERLRLEKFAEVSAVCTYPEFRGMGYGRALVTAATRNIFAAGRMPFLHVAQGNDARWLYEKIGYRVRRGIHLTVFGK